jgi:hypothetical protein
VNAEAVNHSKGQDLIICCSSSDKGIVRGLCRMRFLAISFGLLGISISSVRDIGGNAMRTICSFISQHCHMSYLGIYFILSQNIPPDLGRYHMSCYLIVRN